MGLQTETMAAEDGWKIKKIYQDGQFSHYVLRQQMESGRSSTPFDKVRATGGLLKLVNNGETSTTFTGVIDGTNRYVSESSPMPKIIFETLESIGPY